MSKGMRRRVEESFSHAEKGAPKQPDEGRHWTSQSRPRRIPPPAHFAGTLSLWESGSLRH